MKFKHDKNLNVDGTHLKDHFMATYEELESLLGEPCEGDGYKVSTEWKVNFEGFPFTIYDWKSTKLYDQEKPTVKEFRESEELYRWHIGGIHNADRFILKIWDALENE